MADNIVVQSLGYTTSASGPNQNIPEPRVYPFEKFCRYVCVCTMQNSLRLEVGLTDIHVCVRERKRDRYTYSGPRNNQITSHCASFLPRCLRGLCHLMMNALASMSPNGRWPPLPFPGPESFDKATVRLNTGSLAPDQCVC